MSDIDKPDGARAVSISTSNVANALTFEQGLPLCCFVVILRELCFGVVSVWNSCP